MNIVNFILAGVQKAGTSAAHHYLLKHPDLRFAKRKEVHFFDNDQKFKNHAVNYDWYSEQFSDIGGRLLGEATPIYFWWEPVAERVFHYNPKMKWIVILRNPITRAYSQWNMEYSKGNETLPFREAIAAELVGNKIDPSKQCRVRSYLDRGRYVMQIERLLKWFPPEQLLFVMYEEFSVSPDKTLGKICNFLGVEPLQPVESKRIHSIPYEENLSLTDWSFLMSHLETEIDALEWRLGWNCTNWRLY